MQRDRLGHARFRDSAFEVRLSNSRRVAGIWILCCHSLLYFWGYVWNLFSSGKVTIEEIRKELCYAGLHSIDNFGLGKWAKIERNDGHHRSIEDYTRENTESVNQYSRIVWASLISSLEVARYDCLLHCLSLAFQPQNFKIKQKSHFQLLFKPVIFYFFSFGYSCFAIVLWLDILGVFLRFFLLPLP